MKAIISKRLAIYFDKLELWEVNQLIKECEDYVEMMEES